MKTMLSGVCCHVRRLLQFRTRMRWMLWSVIFSIFHGSTSHNVEVCVMSSDENVAEEPGPPTSDCGRVAEVVEECQRGPKEIAFAVCSSARRDAPPQFESGFGGGGGGARYTRVLGSPFPWRWKIFEECPVSQEGCSRGASGMTGGTPPSSVRFGQRPTVVLGRTLARANVPSINC